MKKIGILGSTGSIGSSAISLIKGDLKGIFEVSFLSFHENAELALQQALEVEAKRLYTTSKIGYEKFKKLYNGGEIEIFYGENTLKEACQDPSVQVILLAIVGVCGLKFALSSILSEQERVIAIANKESIICGNHIIQKKLKGTKTRIIPVDSEHNSLFRLLNGFQKEEISSIFITASGGPFLGRKFADLQDVSVKDVIRHPTWNMGAKISVDSATMANKGLELIEACRLFNFEAEKIQALVCKGSILHAGVNLHCGASFWFLSQPDMKNHISHSILGGQTKKLSIPKVCPVDLKNISFEELKPEEFPIFFLAKEVAKSRSIPHAISFNILNEIAVHQFLNGKIKYIKIIEIIEKNLNYNPNNLEFTSVFEIEEYFIELKNRLELF